MVPNMKTSSQRVDCFENGSLATMTVSHLATYQSCHSSFEHCHFNVAFKYSDAGTGGPGGQIIPTYYHWHPQSFSPSGITVGYSEKAPKFEKIFHLKFDATQ